MSHAIEMFTFTEKTDKKAITNEVSAYAQRNSDGGGLYGGIDFKDLVFDSYELAYEWINEHDKTYYNVGVKYRVPATNEPTKRSENAREKALELRETRDTFIKEHSIHNRKSEFIGCPKCKSKLANAHFSQECCPLCYTDLRPKSTLDSIANYEKKIQEQFNIIKEEEIKQAKKSSKLNWLVKFEYHC